MIWKDSFDAVDIFQNKSIMIFSVIVSEVKKKAHTNLYQKSKKLTEKYFFQRGFQRFSLHADFILI